MPVEFFSLSRSLSVVLWSFVSVGGAAFMVVSCRRAREGPSPGRKFRASRQGAHEFADLRRRPGRQHRQRRRGFQDSQKSGALLSPSRLLPKTIRPKKDKDLTGRTRRTKSVPPATPRVAVQGSRGLGSDYWHERRGAPGFAKGRSHKVLDGCLDFFFASVLWTKG